MIELPLAVDMDVDNDSEYEMEVGTVPNLPNVCVKGSFTVNESGVHTISVPYRGKGYPIGIGIMIEGGTTKTSPYRNLKQSNAIGFICMNKINPTMKPVYGHNSEDEDGCAVMAIHTNTSGSLLTTVKDTVYSYSYVDPASNMSYNAVIISSATSFKVIFTDGTTKGFLPNWKYDYYVVYSE